MSFQIQKISGRALVLAGLTLALIPTGAQARYKERLLYSFAGGASDGANPYAGLIADAKGNLYGTTVAGGIDCDGSGAGCGTVFKLTPKDKESVLHEFGGGSDGAFPAASLIADAKGNLYGTTSGDNIPYGGTVFKLKSSRRETALYGFSGGSDGANPFAGLIADANGNFYGTTSGGGAFGDGAVVKLTPKGKEIVVYSFGGSDGDTPHASLLMDSAGDFYGTTFYGGASGGGTVFKLLPNGVETVLFSFGGGSDGGYPDAGLIADAKGNLYGTTEFGGADCDGTGNGCGTVFKLTPKGKETVLYSFGGQSEGANPYAGLIADASGNLYGTTIEGGADCDGTGNGCGTVFKLTPKGKETVLYSFDGSGGANPRGGLIVDAKGNLYGTTYVGGAHNRGTVFELEKL